MLRTGSAARVSFSLLIGVYFTTGANPDAGLKAESNRQVGISDLLCDVFPCYHFFLVGNLVTLHYTLWVLGGSISIHRTLIGAERVPAS